MSPEVTPSKAGQAPHADTMMPPHGLRNFLVAWTLAWVTLLLTYCVRIPIRVLKIDVGADLGLTGSQLGLIDLSFLLPYSAVQIVGATSFGAYPHKNLLLGACLTVASLAMAASGASANLLHYCCSVIVSGAAQAPIWGLACSLVKKVTSKQRLAFVMGSLSTAMYFGAILSTVLVSNLTGIIGWRNFFAYTTTIPCILVSILTCLCPLNTSRNSRDQKEAAPYQQILKPQEKLTLMDMLRIPSLLEVTVSLFFILFVRYALIMWLSLYLHESLDMPTSYSGMLTAWFDVGSALGGPLLGLFIDRTEMPALRVISASLLMAFLALWAMVAAPTVPALLITSLVLSGVCICGPSSIITGYLAIDLAELEGRATSTAVISLINGLGLIGCMVEGPLIGYVANIYGWNSVFTVMMVAIGGSLIFALRANCVLQREKARVQSLADV